jgi:hypothetical protein
MSGLGSARTLGYFNEWNRVLLEPSMGRGVDRSRAEELLDVYGTDNQAFRAIIHNWIISMRRSKCPREPFGRERAKFAYS